MSDVAGPSP